MRRPLLAYPLALASLVAVVALRWLLDPLMGDQFPLVTLYGAVAGAVWVGGHKPALLVTLLGYLACSYLFIEPRGTVLPDNVATWVGLVAYLFTCSLIVGIGEAMRSAQSRAGEGEELLRVTLGSIGDAVITTDTGGRVTYLNPVAEALTGWSAREAAGQALSTVFPIVNEESRQPVENPALRALREGAVVGLTNHTILLAKDGVERAIDDSAAPIKGEDGQVSGSVLIFRDISERRRWERDEATRLLSARQLASIVESSDDAIIRKSLDGIIQSWNAGAEHLFGYAASEVIGRHISLVIPSERIAEEDQIVASLRAGQRVDHFQTERRHSSGRLIWVSLTISPITDAEGRVVAASKIARDVTRQRELEESLRTLAADLSATDRQKNEFLATLAHELRNPLAPLANMLELLKRVESDSRARGVALESMERQLQQLVRLVDDLLDLNRITHNRLELRRSPIDLRVVLEQAMEVARPLADAAGHRLRLEGLIEEMHLSADAVRLAQVFGNLLNNSCKYTEPGGTITVRVERQQGEAVVSVEDTGAGIPPDRVDSIFDMFTQIEHSRERAQGGLGIGLTLVRQLVQMHGGSVEARSAGEGKGSQFVVRLPISLVEPAPAVLPAMAPPAVAPRDLPSRRILVVDDNKDAAASLTMLLELDGHQVVMAHDGAAACDAAASHRPEVVLLDIGLPVLDGYEVCRRLRREPWSGGIVVLALTGWGQEEDRHRTRAAGFDGHLVKPVDYTELLTVLGSLSVGR